MTVQDSVSRLGRSALRRFRVRRAFQKKVLHGALAVVLATSSLIAIGAGFSMSAAQAAIVPGALDTAFKTNVGSLFGSSGVKAVVIQSDGKIVAAGGFTTKVARVNADGTPDTAFNSTFSAATNYVNIATGLAINPTTGAIVIGDDWNGPVQRVSSAGAADTTFNTNAKTSNGNGAGTANAVIIQPDGKILEAGQVYTGNYFGLKRINADGTADGTFAANTVAQYANAMALQSDGSILVGGSWGLKRVTSTGVLDAAFNTNTASSIGSNAVHAIVVSGDGSILVGGAFTGGLMRLNPDGTAGAAFASTPGTIVKAIALAPDGKIVVGGTFTGKLKRYNADGSVDPYFTVTTTDLNVNVNALAVQSTGDIIAGLDSGTVTLARFYGSYPMPATPAAPTASANADGTITVTTGAVASAVAPTPTSYTVSVMGDPTKNCTVSTTATSCVVSGLTVGSSYQFVTIATLGDKTSPASPASTAVTTVDSTAPSFVSAALAADGTTLTLTYNEPLEATTAATTAFAVTVAGSQVNVSSVVVTGSTVVLTLATAAQRAETVNVSYAAPASSPLTSNPAIQDTSGNDAASLTTTAVTNDSQVDTVAPLLTSATVGSSGTTITLTYGEPLNATTAATSAYTVTVAGTAATVSSAVVSGSTVVLTVSPTINGGQAVTVDYAAPTSSTSTSNAAVQDTAGNDALSLVSQSVTNGSAQGPPVISGAALSTNGTTLTLTYTQNLYTSWSNFPNQYTFMSDGVRVYPSSVSLNVNTLVLTFSPAITSNRTVTVSYTPPSVDNSTGNTSATQNTLGIDAPAQTNFPVTNNSTAVGDIVAPVFSSAALAANGTTLTLSYGEALGAITAGSGAFTAFDNGSPIVVSGVIVSGSNLVLTLSSQIESGHTVTVSYTPPTPYSGAGNAAIQDAAGNDSVALTMAAVTNGSTAGPDITPPVYQSMTVGSNTVALLFNEGLSSNTASLSNYTVYVGNDVVVPSSATTSGATVTLTMPSAIPAGAKVIVVYSPPAVTSGTSNPAVQDARGNDATTFTATTGTNSLVWDWSAGSPTTVGCQSGGFYSNSSRVATLPSGVQYTVSVGGNGYVCLSGTPESLNARGGQAGDFTSAGLVTEPGAWLETSNAGCVSGVLCADRGTVTITYSQPVTNPVLSFAGLGGGTGSTAAWSVLKVLTPGVTLSVLSGTNIAVTQNGTQVEPPTGKIPSVDCHMIGSYGANSPAVCGSLLVNGTVSSVTFQIDMANSGGITGTGIGYRDQWNLTASIPEDLGLVPASYEVGGLAAHVINGLKMGSIVTSDQVSSDANSTFNPAAVSAGAAIPAHADDGVSAWPALDTRDAGTTYTVPISLAGVTSTAYLCGWIDFNRDGTFTPGERACATNPTSGATSASISWTVPQDVVAGLTYMRLRLSYDPLPLPTGVVASGEVEDYSMMVTGPAPGAPIAAPDATQGPYNAAQSMNLLTNDTPSTGSSLTASSVKLCNPNTTPAQVAPNCTVGSGSSITVANVGTYSVSNTGVVTFTPVTGYTGTPAALAYQVTDANGQVADSNYTPTVFGPPTATPNTTSGPLNTAQTTNILGNDSAAAGTTLVPGSVRLCDPTTTPAQTPPNCAVAPGSTISVPGVGTYTVTNTGAITFTPVTGYTGTPTPLKYQISDNLGQVANSTYTPTVIGAPTATPNTTSGPLDTPQSFNLLNNDSAATGATLVATSVKLCDPTTNPAQTSPNCTVGSGSTVSVPNVGTYTVSTAGVITFTPVTGYTGTPPALGYQVSDNLGQVANSTYTPTIIPPPTASPETTSGPMNTAQTLNLAANDTPGAGGSLVVSSIKLCDPSVPQLSPNCTIAAGTTLTVTGVGTYVVSVLGVVTFTPVNNYTGTPPALNYQISDALGQVATSTYTPTIIPAPTATPNSTTGPMNTAQSVNVTTNDTAAAGTTLDPASVKLCDPATNPAQTAPNCTATSVTVPNVGTYTVASTGVVTFTPVSGYTGTPATSVTYQVSDNLGQVASSTYTPNVYGVTTAAPDTTSGPLNTAQTFNLTTNDIAGFGATIDPTTVKLCDPTTTPPQQPNNCTVGSGSTISVPNVGTYTVDANGVVTFTPVNGYTGTPTPLKYQVTDSLGQLASSTYTPTVIPAPTAAPDTSSGLINTPQTANLLTTDAAATGATLNAASVKLCDPTTNPAQTAPNCTVAVGSTVTVPNVGTYTVNSSGVITFTPVTGYTGTPPALGYQVADNLGQIASSTYTPTVFGTPTAAPDTTTGPLNTAQTSSLLPNDTAAAGTSLVATTVKLCANGQTSPNCTATTVTVTGVGTYAVDAAGVMTFTPVTGYTGTPAALPYQVTDNKGQVATSTYTPTVYGAPTATPNTTSGPLNTAQTVNILTNDTPGAGTTFDLTTLKLCAPSGSTVASNPTLSPNGPNCIVAAGDTITVPGVGTYSVNAAGLITFTPVTGYVGTPSPLTYSITDNKGQTVTSTYTPTVIGAPTATPNTTIGPLNTAQTVNILTNDTAATGTTLTPSTVKLCDPAVPETSPNCTIAPGSTITVANVGTYSVTSAGDITFTPVTGYTGTPAALNYQVSDALGQKATSTYTPTVYGAPVANPDTTTNALDVNQTFNVVTNDVAGAGTTLNPASVKLCATGQTSPNCNATTVTVTGVGTYTVDANGVITFDPLPTYTGTPAALSYQVTDNKGQVASSTYTPTVYGPPVASPNVTSGIMDVNQTVNLVTNDAAGAGTTLDPSTVKLCDPTTNPAQQPNNCTATSVTVPGVGTYSVDSSGVMTFDPLPTYVGTPTPLKYQISDNKGQVANSTYTPTVIGAPTATPNTTSGPQNTPQSVNILTNDAAATGTTLVASTVLLCDPNTNPAQTSPNCTVAPGSTITVANVGTYSVTAAGVITFTPVTGYIGTPAPLNYQVSDALGQKATSTYTPTVYEGPTANPDTTIGPLNTAQTKALLTNDTPASATTLVTSTIRLCAANETVPTCTATTVTVPNVGTYALNTSTGVVTFTPVTGYTGTPAPLAYTIADTHGMVGYATYTPTVYGAPVANPNTTSGPMNTAQSTNIFTNDVAGALTTLDVTTIKLCATGQTSPNCTATTVTVANVGTYVLDPTTGVITFTPVTGYTGTPAPLAYQVSDNKGQTATSTYTPTIIPPPALTPDAQTTAWNTAQSYTPLSNDQAGSGTTLVAASITLCDPNSNPAQVLPNCTIAAGTPIVVANEGTYLLLNSGVVTFTPLSTFVGTATGIHYTVTDALGQVSTTTITPTILPIVPPVANPDRYSTFPMTPITVNPVVNDVRGSGPLVASTVLLCAPTEAAPTCASTSVAVTEGVFTVQPTGQVTFTPNELFDTTHPVVIPYIILDANGLSTHSTITIDDPPLPVVIPQLVNTGLNILGSVPGVLLLILAGAAAMFIAARRRKPAHVVTGPATISSSRAYSQLMAKLTAVETYRRGGNEAPRTTPLASDDVAQWNPDA